MMSTSSKLSRVMASIADGPFTAFHAGQLYGELKNIKEEVIELENNKNFAAQLIFSKHPDALVGITKAWAEIAGIDMKEEDNGQESGQTEKDMG